METLIYISIIAFIGIIGFIIGHQYRDVDLANPPKKELNPTIKNIYTKGGWVIYIGAKDIIEVTDIETIIRHYDGGETTIKNEEAEIIYKFPNK